MARNPEFDHEFKENREQKPVIFTSADVNLQGGGAVPKYTDGVFLGELMTNGNAHTELKNWQRVIIIAGVLAAAAFVTWAVATLQQTFFPPWANY